MINLIPKQIHSWIDGAEHIDSDLTTLVKKNPHTGQVLTLVDASGSSEVSIAVRAAKASQVSWSLQTPISRGQILYKVAYLMMERKAELAEIVATETGKPKKDALGEVEGAIAQALFFAGEGARLYGRSLTSGTAHKSTYTVRQPRGVAALIVPANTPIANVAWKLFPALICGNGVIIKASEDAPYIANYMAKLAEEAGVPRGLINVIQGSGSDAGAALVRCSEITVISFTGSTNVGRWIAQEAGKRLARVSLELGGKNPFVVCDDADIAEAAKWAVLSAFSNAGQRCAAGSRIILMRSIKNRFVEVFLELVKKISLGVGDADDLGPVINEKQMTSILFAIDEAKKSGAKVLCGGIRSTREACLGGYYIEPTLIDGVSEKSTISQVELFGPVAVILEASTYEEALSLANQSVYGLTAAIHTTSVDRAAHFTQHVKAGVVNVNLGTYGSEPHMPFGGFGDSGNGTREPGVEALDVYSELKNISYFYRNGNV